MCGMILVLVEWIQAIDCDTRRADQMRADSNWQEVPDNVIAAMRAHMRQCETLLRILTPRTDQKRLDKNISIRRSAKALHSENNWGEQRAPRIRTLASLPLTKAYHNNNVIEASKAPCEAQGSNTSPEISYHCSQAHSGALIVGKPQQLVLC